MALGVSWHILGLELMSTFIVLYVFSVGILTSVKLGKAVFIILRNSI